MPLREPFSHRCAPMVMSIVFKGEEKGEQASQLFLSPGVYMAYLHGNHFHAGVL